MVRTAASSSTIRIPGGRSLVTGADAAGPAPSGPVEAQAFCGSGSDKTLPPVHRGVVESGEKGRAWRAWKSGLPRKGTRGAGSQGIVLCKGDAKWLRAWRGGPVVL